METDHQRTADPRTGPDTKRKYEPPAISSQKVFETTALACKKVTGGPCGVKPKS